MVLCGRRSRLPTPCRCQLWLCRLFSFCTVKRPAHHRAYRNARSRDRERGLSKLSGVDVHVYTSQSDRLLFRLWQRYGPARAHSGASLLSIVIHITWPLLLLTFIQFGTVKLSNITKSHTQNATWHSMSLIQCFPHIHLDVAPRHAWVLARHRPPRFESSATPFSNVRHAWTLAGASIFFFFFFFLLSEGKFLHCRCWAVD